VRQQGRGGGWLARDGDPWSAAFEERQEPRLVRDHGRRMRSIDLREHQERTIDG
jgi:hypothetical protein